MTQLRRRVPRSDRVPPSLPQWMPYANVYGSADNLQVGGFVGESLKIILDHVGYW